MRKKHIISVRNNVFETNSSSSHTLTIAPEFLSVEYNFDKYELPYHFINNKEFRLDNKFDFSSCDLSGIVSTVHDKLLNIIIFIFRRFDRKEYHNLYEVMKGLEEKYNLNETQLRNMYLNLVTMNHITDGDNIVKELNKLKTIFFNRTGYNLVIPKETIAFCKNNGGEHLDNTFSKIMIFIDKYYDSYEEGMIDFIFSPFIAIDTDGELHDEDGYYNNESYSPINFLGSTESTYFHHTLVYYDLDEDMPKKTFIKEIKRDKKAYESYLKFKSKGIDYKDFYKDQLSIWYKIKLWRDKNNSKKRKQKRR